MSRVDALRFHHPNIQTPTSTNPLISSIDDLVGPVSVDPAVPDFISLDYADYANFVTPNTDFAPNDVRDISSPPTHSILPSMEVS